MLKKKQTVSQNKKLTLAIHPVTNPVVSSTRPQWNRPTDQERSHVLAI